MAYRSIVDLIDAEVERLIAARDLLLNDARKAESLAPVAAGPALVEEIPTVAKVARKAVGVRPAPRRMQLRLERKQPVLRKKVPMQTALAAAIPAGPVVVSAAAVAARQKVVVQEKAALAKAPAPPPGEGTLDALLRELQARSKAS